MRPTWTLNEFIINEDYNFGSILSKGWNVLANSVLLKMWRCDGNLEISHWLYCSVPVRLGGRPRHQG